MPYAFEKYPINNSENDKRVKLTDEMKKEIVAEYETGLISIRALAERYKVSRRTIQFTLFPERKEKAKKQFAERQKSGRYYNKDKHREYTKKHREHKKQLWDEGLIKKD